MARMKRFTAKDSEEFDDEFHRLLGYLVRHSARFDFYVGLQLNWMADYYNFKLNRPGTSRRSEALKLGKRRSHEQQALLGRIQD